MESKQNLILIVEDDADTRRMIKSVLTGVSHRVIEADCASVGFHLFQKEKPALVVLDIILPDGSGFDMCRKIREHKTLSVTPVIMLTGKSKLDDKMTGFSAGADQYLVKPIHPKELLMWVEALMRRLALDREEGPVLQAGELCIDLDSHIVRFRDQVISNLTGKEFDLLYFLVKSRPKILSRKYILSNLWHTIAVDHVVDTHINNLRKKLPPEVADRIQAVPGKGFRFFQEQEGRC